MPKGKSSQKDNKGTGATEIEKNISNVIQKLKNSEESLKEELSGITLENASEVSIGDNKHCYLVRISDSNEKNLKKVHKLLVEKLEQHFSNPVVVIPAKKRINGNLYKRYQGTKVPRDRTLTAVFDSYLDELVYPGTIIGKRIRYPQGKARHFKIFMDPLDKSSLEYKVPSITACYKALTNRDLEVQF